jgi:uncharacterized membrane protein
MPNLFPGHTPIHQVNLAIHVLFGTVALALGIVAIVSPKRRGLHTRVGMLFIYAYLVVVTTASIGLAVFNFRSFLAVVTILSIYDVFSGYRALTLRGRRPQLMDNLFSLAGLLTPWIFLAIMRRLQQPWAPALTWSILGGLIAVSTYDLLRNILPVAWLRRTWVQEHLYKMMSAYIAITSAFAGTVFAAYMPWAAILPSAIGTMVWIGFFIAGPRAWKRNTRTAA